MHAIISGPHGVFQPEDKYGYVIIDEAGGCTRGDLLQTDHANVVATSKNPGSTAYSLYHARQTDADATSIRTTSGFIYSVALETKAQNARCRVQYAGQVPVARVNAATVAGSCLVPVAGSFEMGLAAQGAATNKKIVGIALEADAANLAAIIFDGIYGFGMDA
jgi:hypothetical protein